MKRRKIYILQLDKDDPKRELEFEVAFNLSLTEKQRYKRMMMLIKRTMETVKKYDYPKTPSIIKRS
ncbi:MAG: hypothetical protein HND39_05995 [Ignavibacteriota bacterium]|jgi:hypothetical protein|nr:MAG: hypothetical protein EDM72_09160 [Chlorobiota bacterium]MBE7475816.1 hypothetical protein [Ignavibacteriales bacterium]MBL1122879.1 hypothetical protein [Ignavibacteriota bacterium]MCC7093761.1 hypothetical protein [Ignavibacteriaceae bacterium]MEB2297856.1 hypothetical protein [Ignavibacteria bacterium]